LHFVVISVFDRNVPDTKLGPKDLDLAHQAAYESFQRLGLRPTKICAGARSWT
jgi:hypothetical protein